MAITRLVQVTSNQTASIVMEGPNCVVPTDMLTTWEANGYTKIKKDDENISPKSLVTAVREACEEGGSHVAYTQKKNGIYQMTTFTEYYKKILCISKAFIKLGLEERHSVCISGFNSPEWFLSTMGGVFAGGLSVGLYATNSAETNKFILGDCKANILVVEEESTVEAIRPFWNDLPNLKKIIVWGEKKSDILYSNLVLRWEDVMSLGDDLDDDPLLERQKNMAINQCCVLIYTSGTTGNPKGVMLSHDNIYWECMMAIKISEARKKEEVFVSYLPLSHIAGQFQDVWVALLCLGTVVFADHMALKGTLVETLKEARPTIFVGVPRVWEKIKEGIQDKGRAVGGLKKMVADACKKAGLEYHLNDNDSIMYSVGKKAIYPKVTEALGLDRTKQFVSGAAPLGEETLKYFMSLNIVIQEAYGMSETTGIHTGMLGKPKINSVGRAVPGAEIKIIGEDSKGEGEICMRGRNTMMGYLNREDKTTEDVDAEGWIHSGDVGSIDDDGYLFITGRIKELIITAGGENIAPVPIENAIKEKLPCFSNAVVVGDKKKFLSVFLFFKVIVDVDNNMMPTDNLAPSSLAWCRSLGSDATKVSEIMNNRDQKITEAINYGISLANEEAVSRAAKVQKWMLLPLDLSIPTGELGPTLKLKRFEFSRKYQKEIDELYE